MKGVFVELSAFERHRPNYLDDDAFLALQNLFKVMLKAELDARRTG